MISARMKEEVMKQKNEDGSESDTDEDVEQIDLFRRVLAKNISNTERNELKNTLKNLKK